MRWTSVVVVTGLVGALGGTSAALPPGDEGRGFRDGVNHHAGNDGFTHATGRAVGAGDTEAARMRAHLAYIHDLLAARPPTRPDLAARRAELLGYLAEYAAAGHTPKNRDLPWRSPVFIDDDGAICAVGYLIERSAGRALPAQIARAHRNDFLEDIAAAMPEVRAWVAESGFTLEELASIQPGYVQPVLENWHPFEHKDKLPEGEYTTERAHGQVHKGKMVGAWTTLDASKNVVGAGEFTAGAGTWTSRYADGAVMAAGPYENNQPSGRWKFYFHDGALAAEGAFAHGVRDGAWKFYYDAGDPKAKRTLIASGAFTHIRPHGTWHHYDATGALLATTKDVTPGDWKNSFGGYLLDVVPGPDGVHHVVHEGNIMGDLHRIDMLVSADGKERLYLPLFNEYGGEVYDGGGHRLEKVGGAWESQECKWTKGRKRALAAGDLAKVHGLIDAETQAEHGDHPDVCGAGQPVSAERAARIDALLASVQAIRAQTPAFLRELTQGDASVDDATAGEPGSPTRHDGDDLAKVLAATMVWYIEWPHVDRRFLQVFETLPGYHEAEP